MTPQEIVAKLEALEERVDQLAGRVIDLEVETCDNASRNLPAWCAEVERQLAVIRGWIADVEATTGSGGYV